MTSSEIAKKAYNLFLSKGVTKEGACAIIGNLQAESVLIPNNLEDSYSVSLRMSDVQYTTAVDNGTYTNFVHDSAGYGLAQWTYYTRKQKLLNYAKSQGKSIGDLDMQLSFLIKEFQEDFSSIWNQLKSSNNLYDLTLLLLNKWENPTVKNIQVRYQFAQNWYKSLAGGTGMTTEQAIQKVLDVARSNIGYHESGDNITKFAQDRWDNQFYGWELQGQPWCDVFADYCYCQPFGITLGAAITYQRVGGGSALCSASAQFYRNNGAWYTIPQPGDQAFFYIGGAINHTGIVETVSGSQFTTIEGNASDMVMRRTYYINGSNVAGFGRPKWSLVTNGTSDTTTPAPTPTPAPTTDPAPVTYIKFGNRGDAVKTLQENLIKLGYSCGPDGADGQFGFNTLVAVTKFQRAQKLEVDGVVGPLTQAAIQKALNKDTAPTPTPTPSEGNENQTFAKGDKVKIKDGATYYDGKTKVPNFVLNDVWIIYAINGDRAVINKNVSGTSSIMSPINTKYLEKV